MNSKTDLLDKSNLPFRNDTREEEVGTSDRTRGTIGENEVMKNLKTCIELFQSSKGEKFQLTFKRRLADGITHETEEYKGKYKDNEDFDIKICCGERSLLDTSCEVVKRLATNKHGVYKPDDPTVRPHKKRDLDKIIKKNGFGILASRVGAPGSKFIIITKQDCEFIENNYPEETYFYGKHKPYYTVSDEISINGKNWISFFDPDKKELRKQLKEIIP